VCVTFINLSPQENLGRESKLNMLQMAFNAIFPPLQKYEGSLNKVFMFDKVRAAADSRIPMHPANVQMPAQTHLGHSEGVDHSLPWPVCHWSSVAPSLALFSILSPSFRVAPLCVSLASLTPCMRTMPSGH